MSLPHFLMLVVICISWAVSNVLITNLVNDAGFPPLLFAALRFSLVALVTLRWLWPLPRRPMQLVWIALAVGLHFALFFCGLAVSDVSTASIVGQLTVPFTVILSMIFLAERCGARRAIGTAVAFAGAMLLLWNPESLSLAPGLMLIAVSSFFMAAAYVMLKTAKSLSPLKVQAGISTFSVLPMFGLSLLLEDVGVGAFARAGLLLPVTLVFSAVIVTVIAHTAHFWLIQKYEAGSIASMSLMSPVLTVLLGMTVNGDRFDWRTGSGAVMSLVGIALVAHATMAAGQERRSLRPGA
jgi:O-acetylserine/cysteine efflux transporter